MKKILIALVAAAALASTAAASQATKPAAAPKTTAPATKEAAAKPAKANVVAGEVVSVDAAAKSITIKGADGANQTLTATGNAVAQLAKVKAGEQVHVTVEGTNATKIAKATKSTEKKK